jgi:protein TonB
MINSRSQSALISVMIHSAAIALLLLVSNQVIPTVHLAAIELLHLTDPLPALPTRSRDDTGGGGGMHAIVPAPARHLPQIAPRQFVPPVIQIINPNPKLVMEATIEGPPELTLLDRALPNPGDPLSRFNAISGGTGGPLGIGNSHGTGIGNKAGPGAGDGDRLYGQVYRAGNGVTMPVLIHRVEPEFSEEARKAKYSGTVVIRAEIDQSGRPRNMRLEKSLGLGLDEKALEAVSQWLFKPGTREGKPVTVSAMIEVTFHLL